MLLVLMFSLLFAHQHLSWRDPRDYKCHVENASEVSGSVRRLNIFLQDSKIVETKRKIYRIQKVITLKCFSLQSHVQVNLMHLGKIHRNLTDQAGEKHTLQSLKVVARAEEKLTSCHSCASLGHHRKLALRKSILRGKVFLAGISNCVITEKLPKLRLIAEGLTVLNEHQGNKTLQKVIPPTNDKDKLKEGKPCIFKKVFIAFNLLVLTILFIIYVIFYQSEAS